MSELPLIEQLKLQAGIEANPDQEGLDLFASLIVEACCERIAHNPHINWLTAANAAKELERYILKDDL